MCGRIYRIAPRTGYGTVTAPGASSHCIPYILTASCMALRCLVCAVPSDAATDTTPRAAHCDSRTTPRHTVCGTDGMLMQRVMLLPGWLFLA